jgi:hypothetical protein
MTSIALAAALTLGLSACSSGDPVKTEVRGVVLTNDDPNLGGPNPAVEQFRAGERAAYG